jgi:methionine synthase I (cobalamin-dependent)
VVVYRTDYAPVFESGGVKHFLVESVVAVLEVKAAIKSKARLTEALDNVASSVKALDRTNRGRNRVIVERLAAGRTERENHLHQVFGGS